MTIHDNLKELLPIDFASVPTADDGIAEYIRGAVSHCQAVVDSVPPPPTDFAPPLTSRSDSNVASSGNEVHTNSALESEASFDPAMRKAWGKPLKLSAKDNPMHVAVYKMAAGDRRGAWFARRSVHEGLGFARWKRSLDAEFEESLKVHGKPGEGNVRGIGGEAKIVTKSIPGVGEMHVFHLTAQFPGPSAPRDFVELLVSSTAHPTKKDAPRQYLLISRPCKHPDLPDKSGFVRGQYESVEFIREIPVRRTQAASTSDLPSITKGQSLEKSTDETQGRDRARTDTDLLNAKAGKISVEDAQATIETNKAQGQDVPAQGEGDHVDVPVDDDGEINPHPIEWIMVTRSDPGGSVPRFMVERGTPSAIVSDAGKFLEWATHQEMPVDDETEEVDPPVQASSTAADTATAAAAARHAHANGLTRTVTSMSSSSSSSSDSFVSAGSVTPAINPSGSSLSTAPGADKYTHQERELTKKLEARKAMEGAKLEEAKSKYTGNESRIKKAEDRCARKLGEADDWYEKELGKVQARRVKDQRKQASRERKQLEKAKNSELLAEVERLKQENEQLRLEIEKLKA